MQNLKLGEDMPVLYDTLASASSPVKGDKPRKDKMAQAEEHAKVIHCNLRPNALLSWRLQYLPNRNCAKRTKYEAYIVKAPVKFGM